MTLRLQLLLLALVLSLLPVSGWFTARKVEAALRAAEERALVAAAGALATSAAPLLPAPGERPAPLYAHAAPAPRVVDGFDDDWRPWLAFGQGASARDGALAFTLHLAVHQRRLFGLLVVRDPTVGMPAAGRPADQVLLELGTGFRARISADAPGSARVEKLDRGPGDLPLEAAWRQQPGSGYLLEFSTPLSLARGALAVSVLDSGEGLAGARPVVASLGATADGSGRLWVLPDAELGKALAPLAPEGARLWLLDPGGRVVAHAGLPGSTSHAGLGGGRRVAYDWLAGEGLGRGGPRDPVIDLALTGPELDQALAGRGAVRLRAAGRPSDGVRATAAVPVRRSGAVVGALAVETRVDELLLSTHRAFLGTVVLSVLLTALVATALLLYAARLSYRIRRLSRAAERVAAGEARHLEPEAAGDELGDLARSFAGLLDQLDGYNRYLQELGGRLAHELDTPLTIVRSSLDNMQAQSLPEGARIYLERAREGTDRLTAIFRSMREARRLEQTVARAELESFDLAALLRNCLESYRAVDPEHRYALEASWRELAIVGSPELLAQALDKLVDNARSFAPAGSEIRLELRPARRGGGVVVLVGNQGPPLPEGMAGRIFESMVSVRREGDTLHLGLGLHIVRLIARAHGGRAVARNRRDGSGVEIGLALPPAGSRASGDAGPTFS